MARPDPPPGREREGGPRAVTRNPGDRLIAKNTAAERALGITITDAAVSGRDELNAVRALLAAQPDPDVVDEHWRRICRQMAADAAADGFERGRAAGYVQAIADLKADQHGAVRDLALYLRRWDGPRADFGNPRPGDYTGRQHG